MPRVGGTRSGTERVCSLGLCLGGCKWVLTRIAPTLLADYAAAVEDFARVSRALTAALLDGKSAIDDVQALLAAETRAKNSVALMRMRVVNHWRDSQAELGPLSLPIEDDEQHL